LGVTKKRPLCCKRKMEKVMVDAPGSTHSTPLGPETGTDFHGKRSGGGWANGEYGGERGVFETNCVEGQCR